MIPVANRRGAATRARPNRPPTIGPDARGARPASGRAAHRATCDAPLRVERA
ncbi:hypothetical protein BDSB_27755 [Burkholderia dolosa PC543]|nr:hypothetical protein BDSB_27755 [Burkholderia dolosa PC543]